MSHDGEATLDRAQALLDVKRAAAARKLITAVLATTPTNGRALCLLANSYELDGDYDHMLAAADRAVAAEPDNEWAHRQRAIALMERDEPNEALTSAREAVRLAPHTWQGQVVLAGALAGVGRRRAAFAAARRAIALAPHEAETHYAQGVLRHYLAFGWLARQSYLRALRCDPQHAGSLARLGQIHARGGRVVDAVRHFHAAANAAPGTLNLVPQVDRVMLAVPSWAVVTTMFVAFVLTAGVQPLAWVAAATCVVSYLAVAASVYRRLPVELRPLVWSRLRNDPRYQVRIWCAAGNLAVAVGIGVVSASTLTVTDVDPVVFLGLLTAAIASSVAAAVVVRVTDWRVGRRTSPADRPGGPVELDDPDTLDGAGKYQAFRWFRAGCVVAFVQIAGTNEMTWGPRAVFGMAAVIGWALFCWFRRSKRPTWRDRLWQRSPQVLTTVFGVGIVATIGYVVVSAVMPEPGSDAEMLFLTFTFLSLAVLVITQLVWWLVQLTYGIRRLRTRAAAPEEVSGA